ncbi:RHS repeat domain-containing protein [Chitinophaga sp. MD30]|uniref:RHS repeat domain-containing protein n=1 Tax=Chitinophaga sp. MD30 TaxID=2033437 RepID=UPI000BAF5D88|nr:RHS repeat domain-containing protein [Chitinophaga sp. MD30]ASZ12838.1 hypothetical protein CK934_18690 [Chitinophaga sp. MD30]
MISRNIISPVVEEIALNDEKIVVRQKNNYNFYAGNLILLSNIEKQYGNEPSILSSTFDKYGSKGNIQQYTGQDGLIHSFIWGYADKYPVAEIVGVDYQTAISIVNMNVINSSLPDENLLRIELEKLRQALKDKAIINTYTYSPLVGLTTSTDPSGKISFYEYDQWGRLKVVRDHQGKIVRLFDYQYQSPIQ